MKSGGFFVRYILLIISLLTMSFAHGQGNNEQEISVKDLMEKAEQQQKSESLPIARSSNIPDDDYERGQPRSAMAGYLRAIRGGDYTLASKFLDYRNLSEKTLSVGKEELARQLGVVLNRTLWVDLSNISEDSQGDLADSLPSYRELVGKVNYKESSISILLQRIPRASDRTKIWKISNATVEKIPRLFAAYSYTPLGEWLASNLPTVDLFGVMLWQWLYFSAMLALYYLSALFITWVLSVFLKQVYVGVTTETLNIIKGPFALLLAIIVARNFRAEENVTFAVKAISHGGTLLTIAWCWFLFRLIDLIKIKLADRFVAQDKPLAVYLLRPAGTVIKLLLVLIAALHWLENLGFNASTLMAGLGIGGLAIALAAQKTVENIIGAITLYTSAPVKIGDFCRFGSHWGVVEEIGLRSTRIRTLDRTVLYVANAKFVDMEIENFSEREKIAFRPKIYLSPECSKANIEALVASLREHFATIKKLESGLQRVHVKACTRMGIELNILLYVETIDFSVYLDVINQLNLDILSLMEQHHCKLQVTEERI